MDVARILRAVSAMLAVGFVVGAIAVGCSGTVIVDRSKPPAGPDPHEGTSVSVGSGGIGYEGGGEGSSEGYEGGGEGSAEGYEGAYEGGYEGQVGFEGAYEGGSEGGL